MKMYVVVLNEALLMSTHNICFSGEIRKNIMWIHSLIWSYGTLHLSGETMTC